MKRDKTNPIKKFFLSRSLWFRITCSFIIFAVMLIGCLTFFTYQFTVNILKEKEMLILGDSVEYLENQISTRISLINEEFVKNFEDSKFLEMYLKNIYLNGDFSKRIALDNEFINYFSNLRVRNTDLVQSILLVTDNQEVYSDNNKPKYTYEEFIQLTGYAEAMKNKNKMLYGNYEPEKDYFTIMRSFYFLADKNGDSAAPTVGYQSDSDEDYSVLVFYLKKDYFRKIIQKEAKKRNTGVLILDNNGNLVFKEGEINWLTEEGISSLTESIQNTSVGRYEGYLDKNQVGIHYRTVDFMGWKIVYVYDMNILYKESGQVRNISIYVFFFATLIVLIIASVIAHSVVKPIKLLSDSMDSAIENNLEVTFEPKYNDEVADLTKAFQALMKRITELLTDIKQIERQKRTQELKALQAQINPHFLYNTLDTVYWLAKLEGNEKIGEITSDLAGFFRLSLNKGEDITTVEREVEHITKYLDIQKVRMSGSFDYEIHIDENAKTKRIPKLILQPIVENSLLHGFEGLEKQGHIMINIVTEKQELLFCIIDNGKGIAPDIMKQLNRECKSEQGSVGYAIENVRERIQLYAAGSSGITFDQDYVEGTRVWIRFPIQFEE